MVFLIQHTQSRDTRAAHLKLDELLRAVQNARNTMLDLEHLTDAELDRLHEEFAALREHTLEEARRREAGDDRRSVDQLSARRGRARAVAGRRRRGHDAWTHAHPPTPPRMSTRSTSRSLARLTALLALPATAALAQAPAQAPAAPPPAEQIAAAVLPLPVDLRASATVLGYDAAGKLVTLRDGTGAMRCLADDPAREDFHVACYHRALEPFMARGRALRAQGVRGEQVDSARFREIAAGRLAMPRTGGALYTLSGPAGSWNAAAGKATGVRPLFVYYMPGATGASTGISETPSRTEPWLMFPGTPKAHVMLVGTMTP